MTLAGGGQPLVLSGPHRTINTKKKLSGPSTHLSQSKPHLMSWQTVSSRLRNSVHVTFSRKIIDWPPMYFGSFNRDRWDSGWLAHCQSRYNRLLGHSLCPSIRLRIPCSSRIVVTPAATIQALSWQDRMWPTGSWTPIKVPDSRDNPCQSVLLALYLELRWWFLLVADLHHSFGRSSAFNIAYLFNHARGALIGCISAEIVQGVACICRLY